MILLFGIVFLAGSFVLESVRLYGIPFTGFHGVQRIIRQEALDNFSVVSDLQKDNVQTWLQERKRDLKDFSASPALGSNLRELNRLLKLYREQGSEEAQILEALKNESAYADLRDFLMRVEAGYGNVFHRLAVVDNETGVILVSTVAEAVGRRIPQAPINSQNMGEDGVFLTIDRCMNSERFADFLLAAFVQAGRGSDASRFILVGSVNLNSFLSPVLRSTTGLGQSGEVVLVDQDRTVLMPLKFRLKDGTWAVPLEYQISADPAKLAASGKEGTIEGLDYRGVLVLAAYRNIRLSPEESIGMVLKQDVEEVFSVLRKNKFHSIGITLAGMMAGIAAIFLLTASILRPVQKMAVAAIRVEQGDFSVRINAPFRDEVGILAGAFNQMVERISRWKDELESQVQSRTSELMAANQQLQASEQQLQASNQQLRASQQQLTAINQQLVANEQQLRREVELRTHSEEETKKYLHEMEVFFKASVGREERIIELKQRVEEMERQMKKNG